MSRIREKIEHFIHEISNVSTSDALVNASSIFQFEAHVSLGSTPIYSIDSTWKRLLKTAGELIKDADVNPLCLVPACLKWEINSKEVLTPLVLVPVHWKLNKVNNQVEILPQWDEVGINPFIRFQVKEKTNTSLELKLDENGNVLWLELVASLKEMGFNCSYESKSFFANLHYHRFHLLRELELLQKQSQFSQPLMQLFDDGDETNNGIALSPALLTDADTDHLNLFDVYTKGNLVVQGPPGTGKSQVILNLLGKLLEKKQRVLVVSEKRVALEVIEKKLSQLQLGDLAFVCHSQTKSKEFLEKLEATWRVMEQEIMDEPFLDLFPERIKQVQLLLDRLNQHELLGGISLTQFLELTTETPYEHAELRLDAPETAEWLKHKGVFIELENSQGSFEFLNQLKPGFFQHSNKQRLLETLRGQWQLLTEETDISTWEACVNAYKQLGRLQLVDNAFFTFYKKINSKKSEKRRFEKSVVSFKTRTKELEVLEMELAIWKKLPTAAQIDNWLNLSGFWGKRKLKKELSEYLGVNADLFLKAVEVWKNWWSVKLKINDLEKQFLLWEITPNSAQIDAAWYVYEQFEKEGSILFELAEMPNEKRKSILDHGPVITQFYNDFRLYFNPSNELNVGHFLTTKLDQLLSIQLASEQLKQVPLSIFNLLEFAENWRDIQAIVLKANWIRIETHFPEIAKHSGARLLKKLEEIILEQELGFKKFAATLLSKQKAQFQHFQKLLLTPSTKLTAEEKELKSKLKQGKALLVKEFGKSRQHISIRNLLESEARIWIQTCIPIWMSTPGLVADNFPMESNLVDHLIIDEASQMPLPNALGVIQRANQVLIAGDEQQMSPSSFFGKSYSEHDVLHQADFHFNRTALHHHYRSSNSSLIAFSNRHFYQNKLVVYPKPGNQQAVYRHFVHGGQFINRVNIQEANEVAGFLSTRDLSQSIGLVAFSKEQLLEVWKALPVDMRNVLTEKEEQGSFFMKSLDEVQGDEADQIIISLGYAKNELGNFAMRFGPLNHQNGYKRLNVLLTRAIEQVHFFTSVNAIDFPLSDNENVNLLRQYLEFIEHRNPNEIPKFPYDLQPVVIDGNTLVFKGVETKVQNAIELMTFIKVLKNRGWKLQLM